MMRCFGRVVVAVGILLLPGCLLSESKPFSLDGGDRLELAATSFTCVRIGSQGLENIQREIVEVPGAGSYRYFVQEGHGDWKLITAHRLRDGTYLLAYGMKSAQGFLAGRIIGSGFVLFELTGNDVLLNEAATRHGVALKRSGRQDEYTMSGPVENERRFLTDLAQQPNLKKVEECTPAKR